MHDRGGGVPIGRKGAQHGPKQGDEVDDRANSEARGVHAVLAPEDTPISCTHKPRMWVRERAAPSPRRSAHPGTQNRTAKPKSAPCWTMSQVKAAALVPSE